MPPSLPKFESIRPFKNGKYATTGAWVEPRYNALKRVPNEKQPQVMRAHMEQIESVPPLITRASALQKYMVKLLKNGKWLGSVSHQTLYETLIKTRDELIALGNNGIDPAKRERFLNVYVRKYHLYKKH
jgi:hypothetical protein